MADTFTANYNLTKPEVGASRDTWGAKSNANLDRLDAELKAASVLAIAALPKAGGTMSGDVTITKTDPSFILTYSGVGSARAMLAANRRLRVEHYRSGAWTESFSVGEFGDLYSAQFGDLVTFVNARGAAYSALRVSKDGDTMAGDLVISKSYPSTVYLFPGVRQWSVQTRETGSLVIQDDTLGAYGFAVHPDGRFSCRAVGDVLTWTQARADAAQGAANNYTNGRVAKVGDRMTGDLAIEKAYPTLQLLYPGVREFNWRIREDGRMYLDANGTNGSVIIGPGGDISTAQFGDLNTRIETRAAAYAEAARASAANDTAGANANANTRLSRFGDTSTGDIRVLKGDPAYLFELPGVAKTRWVLGNDARVHLQYFGADGSASDVLSVGPGGDIGTAQFGDLNVRIEARAAAYADDRKNSLIADIRLTSNYEFIRGDGGIAEPGAPWIMTGIGILSDGQLYGRCRALQKVYGSGAVYNIGYA